MKRVLVTGVNGFVGKHLAREFNARQFKIVGVGRDPEAHPGIVPILERYYPCDLTNQDAVHNLELNNIDAVVSLAGLARVGDSFADPGKYKKINVEVFRILGEEIMSRGLKMRVIAISTGAVYDSHQPLPITEDSRLMSEGSPYAQSKILMEEASAALREKGLDSIVVRPFNHLGPGQETGFLLPDLYQKIQTAKNSGSVLKVGNIKTRRDYTDVRDVVRAYANLAEAEHLGHDLYNVCSGKSLAGEEILNLLLEKMGLLGKIKTEQDPNLIRPNDPKDIYGSYERLKNDTNWQPQIKIDQTIEDFVA